MLYGFNLSRMVEADLAYGRALEDMLKANHRFRKTAAAMPVAAGDLPETVQRLVNAALETAKPIQGPIDRSTEAVAYPYPHRNGAA